MTEPNLEVGLGVEVTTETLPTARFFAEPLVRTSEPTADDNRGVARLLENFAHQDADLRALRSEQFLLVSPTIPGAPRSWPLPVSHSPKSLPLLADN